MKHDIPILDADSHAVEPATLWRDRVLPQLPEAGLRYAPSYDDGKPRFPPYTLHGEDTGHLLPPELVRGLIDRSPYPQVWDDEGMSAEFHASELRRRGADLAFVYPTFGLWMWSIDGLDPRLAGALVQAYNDWLFDYCAHDPEFLRPVAGLNMHAPEALVGELEALVARGARSVFVRPNPVGGRMLGDPAYAPLWAACERLGVSVGVHEGTHSRLPTTGYGRFTKRFSTHACSHPMEHMMAFLSLLESGVLERHPTLRFAFLESGCGWLPYWLWRLDEEYEQLAWEVEGAVAMPPSDYFRRQCFIAWEPGEPYLQHVVDCVGEDCVLAGSDFPHVDSDIEFFDKLFAAARAVGDGFARKLAWDNGRAFYGIAD